MYNRLFLIITIASFSFIQSYGIEETSENVTVTVLDEGDVIQTVKKQAEIGLQWQIILILIGIPIVFIVRAIWKKSRKN